MDHKSSANNRTWERALLLPFQSFIVLVFPVFSILDSLYRRAPGDASGIRGLANISIPSCLFCCIVLLISGLIQLADKAYLRRYAYINLGFVVLGIIISVHLASYVFVK